MGEIEKAWCIRMDDVSTRDITWGTVSWNKSQVGCIVYLLCDQLIKLGHYSQLMCINAAKSYRVILYQIDIVQYEN